MPKQVAGRNLRRWDEGSHVGNDYASGNRALVGVAEAIVDDEPNISCCEMASNELLYRSTLLTPSPRT